MFETLTTLSLIQGLAALMPIFFGSGHKSNKILVANTL